MEVSAHPAAREAPPGVKTGLLSGFLCPMERPLPKSSIHLVNWKNFRFDYPRSKLCTELGAHNVSEERS